ncbi:MAG: hypothetical protein JXQ27_08985 [Acidobacteria bacterium]|nr:hypothetical protein [Acidobacteriota bacterium]
MKLLDGVRHLHDRYFTAMPPGDRDQLQTCLCQDGTLIYRGTDETAIRRARREAESFLRSPIENFEKVAAARSPVPSRSTSAGDARLFAEPARIVIPSWGKEREGQVRLSGAPESRDSWCAITPFHRSVSPNQPAAACIDQPPGPIPTDAPVAPPPHDRSSIPLLDQSPAV